MARERPRGRRTASPPDASTPRGGGSGEYFPSIKKGVGRPRFDPTAERRRIVEAVAGFGACHADICLLILNLNRGKPIDEKTLRKHFARELEVGSIKANVAVVKALYENATKGDTTAQIWWTKCRMGWKDTSRIDAPAPVVNINLSEYSDEQLDAIEAALEAIERAKNLH